MRARARAGNLGFRRVQSGVAAGRLRGKIEPTAGLGNGGGGGEAGGQSDEFQPSTSGFQKIEDCLGRHEILAAVRSFQQQVRLQPVTGEVHQVPTFTVLQYFGQRVPRDAVLQDAQVDREFLCLRDSLEELREAVTLLTQIERALTLGEREYGEDAQGVADGLMDYVRVFVLDLEDERNIGERERLAVGVGEFPGQVEKSLGFLRLLRDHDADHGRSSGGENLRADRTEHFLPDPFAELVDDADFVLALRNGGGVVPAVVEEIGEGAVLRVGGIELDFVVGEERAVGCEQMPIPADRTLKSGDFQSQRLH